MEIDINKPIPPNQSLDGWKEVKIEENYEPLVSLNEFAPDYIMVKSQYFEQNINGALEECYCREGVAIKLIEAAKYLPKGYKFLIWDAWRPPIVQLTLFEKFKGELKINNPSFNEPTLQREAEKYVSLPSTDFNNPAPHLTGGAIDLTIIDSFGNNLEMGTCFDSFGEISKTNYFELLNNNIDNIIVNRRLIYNILTSVGFSNYPEEWWHYDYGNQFWGKITDNSAIYNGILKI
jgi:D-alanyl-D-alanine dipeptidase